MRDLFHELDIATWEYQTIKKDLANYQKYYYEIIETYYQNLPEHLNIDALLQEIHYQDYNQNIAKKMTSYLSENNQNIATLKKEYSYSTIYLKSLIFLIIKLSYITPTEFQILFGISLNKGINLFSYKNFTLIINPQIKSLITDEILDFLRYLINMRYNKPHLTLKECITKYQNQLIEEKNIML